MDFTRKKVSRVFRPKTSARRFYDRLSRWYDLIAGSEDWFTFQGLQMVGIQPGEKLLEIGPGTGKGLVKMALAAGEKGQVVALDLSWEMAQTARHKAAKTGLGSRTSLSLGDGAALPFTACLFDAVFMGFTLELFDTPEISQVLGECRRVLRPEGRLGVVSLARPDRFTPMASAYEWVHRNFPNLADCRPIPAAEYLEQAGFVLQHCLRRPMWGMPVDMVVGWKTAEKSAVLDQTTPQNNLN